MTNSLKKSITDGDCYNCKLDFAMCCRLESCRKKDGNKLFTACNNLTKFAIELQNLSLQNTATLKTQ